MTSGSTSLSSLDGIGSNIYVVGLADLTSLYNSSYSIVENEWNCSSGDLYCIYTIHYLLIQDGASVCGLPSGPASVVCFCAVCVTCCSKC